MSNKNIQWRYRFALIFILFLVLGCNLLSNTNPPSSLPTPTITNSLGSVQNRCDGLNGTLELSILVGPSDAAGLEPFSVGEIPFSITSDGDTFTVQGGGALIYEDTLEAEWGTYSVKFNMNTNVTGTCDLTEAGEILKLKLEAGGDQMVEVVAEGFQGDYPWTGTHNFDLRFPLEEGTQEEGEGWRLTLHLNE